METLTNKGVSCFLHKSNKYTVFQKTTPLIILHNSWKYQPISMKISDNIAEGMLNYMSENYLSFR